MASGSSVVGWRLQFDDPQAVADPGLEGDRRVLFRIQKLFRKVDLDKFEKYGLATAMLFRDLYGWFNMPVSVHKHLIHGTDVMRSHILPIGMCSEEAQEARKKRVRQYIYRKIHAQKYSRQNTHDSRTCSLAFLLRAAHSFQILFKNH